MNHTNEVLSKAYAFTELNGQALTPEVAAIRYLFISEENRLLFQDDDLYLAFIQNIMQNRYNASFPDQESLYQQFLRDCVYIKELMHKKGTFSQENWLSHTISLLENLKTPYYRCYSLCLGYLLEAFSEESLLKRVLSSYYALMIKSSAEYLSYISRIASYAKEFPLTGPVSESLLAEILIENAGLLGQEKSFWLNSMANSMYTGLPEDQNWKLHLPFFIKVFMEKEISFSKSLSGQFTNLTIHEFLSGRYDYFNKQASPAPEELFFTGGRARLTKGQNVDSEFLNTYAYNMNQREYISDPAIGREAEINDLALILISPKKSPILLGEAGVGKTSVVEGLAYRLGQGNVPKLLKDKKIFKLTTTALLSGTKYVGEMEERMKQLTQALEEHPDVILFIDEVHTVVGAGSTESSNNDISNMIKPYIDRGDIKIIGATTKEEYDSFIAKDKALSRRFYPIYIEEPSEEITFDILKESIPSIEYATKIKNTFSIEETEEILRELITLTRTKNQIPELALYRPELPLTILEMAFSYAALDSRSSLSRDDLRNAVKRSSRLNKEVRFAAEQSF